jgi:hypothetical protein
MMMPPRAQLIGHQMHTQKKCRGRWFCVVIYSHDVDSSLVTLTSKQQKGQSVDKKNECATFFYIDFPRTYGQIYPALEHEQCMHLNNSTLLQLKAILIFDLKIRQQYSTYTFHWIN